MKTAVITGATSGIGNNILKTFLNNGYIVYAGYREIRQKKELKELSENVIPFRIDLTKKWTIEEAIKTINDNTEKIDVLINVAGKVTAGPLETLSVDKIREQFEVNTFSQLEFSQGLFEKLDGGKIINISSMASYGFFPFLAPYCASKNAMDMLFNSLRIETGSRVKIISVKPGVIATPLWKKAVEENKNNIGTGKYKIVADYLISNAMKNSNKGLKPEVVAKKVLKIANSTKPKNVYVIGLDACGVRILSKLPQRIKDIIIENQLVKRIKAQLNVVTMVPDINKDNTGNINNSNSNLEELSKDDVKSSLNSIYEYGTNENAAELDQEVVMETVNYSESNDENEIVLLDDNITEIIDKPKKTEKTAKRKKSKL